MQTIQDKIFHIPAMLLLPGCDTFGGVSSLPEWGQSTRYSSWSWLNMLTLVLPTFFQRLPRRRCYKAGTLQYFISYIVEASSLVSHKFMCPVRSRLSTAADAVEVPPLPGTAIPKAFSTARLRSSLETYHNNHSDSLKTECTHTAHNKTCHELDWAKTRPLILKSPNPHQHQYRCKIHHLAQVCDLTAKEIWSTWLQCCLNNVTSWPQQPCTAGKDMPPIS